MNVHHLAPVDTDGVRRAFHSVADMERPLERLFGMLRMLVVMELDDIMPDERDVEAVLETVRTAQEALAVIQEKRSAAFNDLHPFAYPPRGGAAP